MNQLVDKPDCIQIQSLDCDTDGTENIIIELSPEHQEYLLKNGISSDQCDIDSPEMIQIETIHNEFDPDGEIPEVQPTSPFLDLIEPVLQQLEGNIVDGIPNEALIYMCQPESNEPINKFPCKSCELMAGCIFCLKSHYESIHLKLGIIQYRCDQTSYLRNYTEICNKCNLVCESHNEMVEHRKIHFVSCDVCEMSFDSALYLSNHCKSTHAKFEVIISCDLCEQWFKDLQALSEHYQEHHEMILCIVCFKRFESTQQLKEHHKSHKIILNDSSPVLPYACSKCNQAFGEISDLSVHITRDHPNRKTKFVKPVRSKNVVLVKGRFRRKEMFDDCGGLSHANKDS